MQMIDYHHEEVKLPSNRAFGLTFFVVFTLLASYSLYSRGEWQQIHTILFSVAGVFFILSFIFSNILTLPNKWWMGLGNFMHKIVNPLVMGILFFGIVTPYGIVMRLFGSDLLELKLDKNKKSYWKSKDPVGPPPESMKNQY